MKPSLAETPARAAPVGAPPAAAAPAAAPSSESGLAAALRAEAVIADGRVPGVYKDEAGGHGACPWRSGIRREGFEHVKSGRHASCAEASLRVLELLQAHPPFIEKDRFTLAASAEDSALVGVGGRVFLIFFTSGASWQAAGQRPLLSR